MFVCMKYDVTSGDVTPKGRVLISAILMLVYSL